MPFLLVLYIVAYLDRTNVAFASLDMTRELGFSNEAFGFGSGIFFIGYVLLEIPGTILVELWSARKWIARIMISWGLVASLTGLIRSPQQFYWIRFLLGIAEAGFFPGIIVYLTHWYRDEDRGKAIAMFMAALPIANIIGAPLSGLLLKADWLGLAGWRWLFILEGIPAIVCGFITIFYLTDWPKDARWLREDERDWLTRELEAEKKTKQALKPLTVWQALHNRDVVLLTLVYFFIVTSNYGFTLWLPKILQQLSGLSSVRVSLIATIPYLAALPLMLLVGWHSDRTGERRWHTALPIFTAGLALAASQRISGGAGFSIALFSVAAMGLFSYLPGFWSMPTTFLSAAAAAACIGLINSFGNVGGFVGPYMVGYLSDKTGSYQAGVLYLVGSAMLSGFLVFLIRGTRQLQSPSVGGTAQK
jgi:D-galactonate transporter